jgi:hypothetical protein
MLMLFAPDRRVVPDIRGAIPPDQEVELINSVADLTRATPHADCSIAAILDLGASPATAHLAAFKMSNPNHPVILITEWEPDNARHLKNLQVDEVVWTEEIRRYLPEVVKEACCSDLNHVRCLAVPLEHAERLPAPLRRALAFACRHENPVHSINQLARVAGVNRRTLWQQWKSVVGGEPLRLQDFLHWILLIRALGHKTPEMSWNTVAEEMGLGLGTLSRYAKQLTGKTLQELHAQGPLNLAQVFRSTVYTFLLEQGDLH